MSTTTIGRAVSGLDVRHEAMVDALVERVAGARLVLLGEASHGTEEFYAIRARVTQRLIAEHGYAGVAAEADWPDAWRVNCFVRGIGNAATASDALGGFERFPRWMWRNHQVANFVDWLRMHNARGGAQAGFYGLDLYSLFGSIESILAYLHEVDRVAERAARRRYECFDRFGRDEQRYGYMAGLRALDDCEAEVVAQLVELARRREREIVGDGSALDVDRSFSAHQNARLVRDAERYYRSMYRGGESSWNLRDTHMADTLDELLAHLDAGRDAAQPARVVVWAHNSHLGDARATQMGREGELNLGQLVRERHPGECMLVGFSTFDGTVTAANDWDQPAQRMVVRPGLAGSYERHLHELGGDRLVATAEATAEELPASMLQRAIGVIYRPRTERRSHYFSTDVREQFDLLVHIDRTTALEPLEPDERWHHGSEPPESYPTGL